MEHVCNIRREAPATTLLMTSRRASFKWHGRSVTVATGILACVEGRQAERSVARAVFGREEEEAVWGRMIRGGLGEEGLGGGGGGGTLRGSAAHFRTPSFILVPQYSLLNTWDTGAPTEAMPTRDRFANASPWGGSSSKTGVGVCGDRLRSAIIRCKTSRQPLSLHTSPLHHPTQSHQIIVRPFIIWSHAPKCLQWGGERTEEGSSCLTW